MRGMPPQLVTPTRFTNTTIKRIITVPNAGFVASQRSLVPVAVYIISIRLAQPARRTPCANLGAHHGRVSIAADHQSCLAIGGTEL